MAPAATDTAASASLASQRPTRVADPANPATTRRNETLVASWQGLEADGQVRFDEQGRLILDRELRRRFDFILSGLGEQSLNGLRQLLADQLAGEFDAARVDQVLSEFDRYVDFLQAADALMASSAPDLRSRFEATRQLQQDLLGEERAQTWFGEENAYHERTLDVLDGRLQPGDPEHDAWAADVEAATAHHLAMEMDQQYRQANMDPALRYVEREALYGSEAADRLAALDAERAAWDARVAAFAAERQRLLDTPGLGPAERERQLQQWLMAEFDEAERRRIEALDREGLIDGPP